MIPFQTLKTSSGEELVVISRLEFDRLCALAAEAEEDAADIAAYDAAKAEFEASGSTRSARSVDAAAETEAVRLASRQEVAATLRRLISPPKSVLDRASFPVWRLDAT